MLTFIIFGFFVLINAQEDEINVIEKEVNVIFGKDFNGSVVYSFLGSDNETEDVFNRTVLGKPRAKPQVDIVFYPNFNGVITFHELRDNNETVIDSEMITDTDQESGAIRGSDDDDDDDEEAPAPVTANGCRRGAPCVSHSDCPGGTCLGFAFGTCNCGACASLAPCLEDHTCGGLKGACDPNTKTCNLTRGLEMNGFKDLFDGLARFCNVKKCEPNSDSCFGLPCNYGSCACT